MKISATEKKMLLWLLIVIVAFLIYNYIYSPLDSETRELSARNAEAQDALDKAEIRLAEKDVIQARYDEAGRRLEQLTGAFYKPSAQEEFITKINELSLVNDVDIISINFLKNDASFFEGSGEVDIQSALAALAAKEQNDGETAEEVPPPTAENGGGENGRDEIYLRFLNGIKVTSASVSLTGPYRRIYDMMRSIKENRRFIVANSLSMAPSAFSSEGIQKDSDRIYSASVNINFYTVSPPETYLPRRDQ
jgi:Tfp pilus assembly protein PilO